MCAQKVSLPRKGFRENTAPHHKSCHREEQGVFSSSSAVQFDTTVRCGPPADWAETLWEGRSPGEPCPWGPWDIWSVFVDEATETAHPT